MDRAKVAEWANGMAYIFSNAQHSHVMHEIEMLLESMGIEQNRKNEHWRTGYDNAD